MANEQEQKDNDVFVIESEDGKDQSEAELVLKIDDSIGLYATDKGENLIVSTNDKLSSTEVIHRFYNSEALKLLQKNLEEQIKDADESESEEIEDDTEISEEDSTKEPSFLQKQLAALVNEDVLLEYVDNVVKIIENLTDEQVKDLGPDGVEELFILLSKFYYAYITMTNPLWEVAQARINELAKWQKLYMDKYYHK